MTAPASRRCRICGQPVPEWLFRACLMLAMALAAALFWLTAHGIAEAAGLLLPAGLVSPAVVAVGLALPFALAPLVIVTAGPACALLLRLLARLRLIEA